LSHYSQVLIVFSTSDYLVNYVLYFAIEELQLIVDTIIKMIDELNNECVNEIERSTKTRYIQALFYNCRLLSNCLESIIKIRNLENFTSISNKLKTNMNSILNTIFIKLTGVYPLLAIEISKLIQLLTLKTD
jgi:F0F1-type ATP synthase delta subunit